MAQEHVLRLRRTDREGEYVLVQVNAAGSKPLDLKLIASENEHVYPAKVKEANVKTLQASNYSGDLDEWKAILRYSLLREQPVSPLPDALQGLETVAAISGETVTITLRKNIGGIHQRLGSIKLEQNDEQEIDIFAWASTAAAAADHLREQNATLQTGAGSQQEQVAKLERQLDDLIQAKKDHEEELLKKFAALLNAKKLKIRDQQRMLAGAKVDPRAAATVSDSRNGSGSARKAAASRKGKRKANRFDEMEEAPVSDEDAATEDGALDDDDLMREQETPVQTEDEVTEGEDEDDQGFDAAQAASLTGGRGVGSKGKAFEATHGRANGGSTNDVDGAGSIPPRRELPFGNKSADTETKKPEPVPAPAPAEDEDEETDDDEL